MSRRSNYHKTGDRLLTALIITLCAAICAAPAILILLLVVGERPS